MINIIYISISEILFNIIQNMIPPYILLFFIAVIVACVTIAMATFSRTIMDTSTIDGGYYY